MFELSHQFKPMAVVRNGGGEAGRRIWDADGDDMVRSPRLDTSWPRGGGVATVPRRRCKLYERGGGGGRRLYGDDGVDGLEICLRRRCWRIGVEAVDLLTVLLLEIPSNPSSSSFS